MTIESPMRHYFQSYEMRNLNRIGKILSNPNEIELASNYLEQINYPNLNIPTDNPVTDISVYNNIVTGNLNTINLLIHPSITAAYNLSLIHI